MSQPKEADSTLLTLTCGRRRDGGREGGREKNKKIEIEVGGLERKEGRGEGKGKKEEEGREKKEEDGKGNIDEKVKHRGGG